MEKQYFSLETKVEFGEVVNGNKTFKCYVAYPELNRKKIDIPKEVFEEALSTALGIPVVAHFFKDGKLGGHESDLVKVGFQTRMTGKTHAYGVVRYDKMPYWEERSDGKEWLCMDGYLFTNRFPEAEKILKATQSMEVKLDFESVTGEYKKVKGLRFLALCALNPKGVTETFEDSRFEQFSINPYENEYLEEYYDRMRELFKSDEFAKQQDMINSAVWLNELIEEISEIYGYDCTEEDVKLLYECFYEERTEEFAVPEKYKHIDFKPPVGVAKQAQRGLDLRAKQPDSNKCCTPVGLARARQLINRQNLPPSTIKRMKSYFDRHQVDKKGEGWGKDSKGYQAYLIWGNEAGYRWAKKIVNQMNKAGS